MVTRLCGFRQRTRPRGGDATGPNPTDRGKKGSKHHIIVDRQGIPLAATVTAANVHDSKEFEHVLDAIQPIKQPRRGRPRKRPAKVHADKGYDYPRCRKALKRRLIADRIARRGVDASDGFGKHRWVVERTLSWLHRFRRLRILYERRSELHQAFLDLACALICWQQLQRLC